MKELVEKTRKWFYDKGIIEKSTAAKQLRKTQEELTETRDAVIKFEFIKSIRHTVKHGGLFDDADLEIYKSEIIDGIGDTVVTLIGVAEMLELDYEDITNLSKDIIVDSKSTIEHDILEIIQNDLLDLIVAVEKGYYSDKIILTQIHAKLEYFSVNFCGVNIETCLQAAYDVISKRTGKIVDGVFVKDN